MKNFLLLMVSFTLLFFTMPKKDSVRSYAQQAEIKKDCNYSKHSGKKSCARKCLKHQTHSSEQNNTTGIAADCSQQVFAIVTELQIESIYSFTSQHDFIVPLIRKHLSPVLEYDPQPPRLS